MGIFKMRERRYSVEFSVTIALCNRRTGHVSPHNLPATMVNLSSKGACVVVRKTLLDGRHIFFDSQKNEDHLLQLSGLDPEGRPLSVQAQAVWMDSCIHQGGPAFKLGMEFTKRQTALLSSLAAAPQQSS